MLDNPNKGNPLTIDELREIERLWHEGVSTYRMERIIHRSQEAINRAVGLHPNLFPDRPKKYRTLNVVGEAHPLVHKLVQILRDRGIQATPFCDAHGLDRNLLSRWQRGPYNPHPRSIERFFQALGYRDLKEVSDVGQEVVGDIDVPAQRVA